VFVAFPIHIWSIVNMLYATPSLILSMSGPEILGSWAYNMVFTLFETMIILLFVLAIGILVSIRWSTTNYVTLSSILLTEIALMRLLFESLPEGFSQIGVLVAACFVVIAASVILVPNNPKWKVITRAIAARLEVLTGIYILIDIASVIIVIACIIWM
jgi:hypothetical protein